MKLEKLRQLVEEQYLAKNPGREDWADWLYTGHVLWVANKTDQLCERFGGNKDIAVAAALLHDIADSVMQRENDRHEQESLEIARALCAKAGYTDDETSIVVDDICLKHSCHDGIVPNSLEGKIVATADACAHFETEFYFYAFAHGSSFGDYNWMLSWTKSKIKRDFEQKIFFEDVQKDMLPIYESLARMLSSR